MLSVSVLLPDICWMQQQSVILWLYLFNSSGIPIVADLERRDAVVSLSALLDACQVILAGAQCGAGRQPGSHAVGDDAALLNLVVERIGVYLPARCGRARRSSGRSAPPAHAIGRRPWIRAPLEQFDRKKRILELHQFRGVTRAAAYATRYAPCRPPAPPARARCRPGRHPSTKCPDFVQPFVDLHGILDGHGDPTFEQAAAPRGERAIDDIGEAALLAPPFDEEQLEVADREFVDPRSRPGRYAKSKRIWAMSRCSIRGSRGWRRRRICRW